MKLSFVLGRRGGGRGIDSGMSVLLLVCVCDEMLGKFCTVTSASALFIFVYK